MDKSSETLARKHTALPSAYAPPRRLPKRLRTAAANNKLLTPEKFAIATGLRYITDAKCGIHRSATKTPNSFTYTDVAGRKLREPATLRRIRSLVIPPAWREVWINPSADGHIQATGIDARGRKQYRYHPHWRKMRDETKFHRLIAFGKALPRIRRRTSRDLKLPGLPRVKVLAAIVQLLEKTLIRVGNSEYARDNHSYGLTTILNKQVRIRGQHVHFEFRGKSGVDHSIDLADPRLANIVKACQDLPGQELFGYKNHLGKAVDINSSDVNGYIHEITGEEFTAKDFRTWTATVLAAKALQEVATFDSESEAKKNVVAAVEAVAKRLGNTRSVCRKCYIHPAIIDAYMDGSLLETLAQRTRQEMREVRHLRPEEAAILAFLQECLQRDANSRVAGNMTNKNR